MHIAGNGTCQGEVLDGSVVDVAEEGCAAVAVVGNRCGDGMAVAVERTAEGVHLCAVRHQAYLLADADVGHQLHRLSGESAGAVVHGFGECVPFCFIADVSGAVRRVAGSSDVDGLRAGVVARAGEHQCVAARRADVDGKILRSVSVQRDCEVSAEGEGCGQRVSQHWCDEYGTIIQIV